MSFSESVKQKEWIGGRPAFKHWSPAILVGILALTSVLVKVDALQLSLLAVGFVATLWISNRWPWAYVALVLAASSSFMHLVDVNLLPSLVLTKGFRFNFLDLLLVGLLLLGLARISSRQSGAKMPRFSREILLIIAAVFLSMIWGVARGSIDLDRGIAGLRSLSGLTFYLGLAPLVSTAKDRSRMFRVIVLIVIASLAIQCYELASQARFVLPTSTIGFYQETKYISVGDSLVPYLYNRTPGLLFLVFFTSLSNWFIRGSRKHLVLASLCLLGFVFSLVRFWTAYLSIGTISLALLALLVSGRSKKSVFSYAIGALGVGLVGLAVSINGGAFEAVFSRLSSLVDFQNQSSFLIRLHSAKVFFDTFTNSPVLGQGPGSLGLVEEKFGVWSTDLGVVATLAEFGMLANLLLGLLLLRLAAITRRAGMAARTAHFNPRGSIATAQLFGVSTYFLVAFVAFLFTQDFFFRSPWSFASGVGLVLLDGYSRAVKLTASYSSGQSRSSGWNFND